MRTPIDEVIARLNALEKWRERQETLEPRRTWLFSQIADVTVANTAAETTLVGSGVGSLVLPANYFVPGRALRLTAGGAYTYTSNPTIVLRTYFNSSNMSGTGVMTLAGTQVVPFYFYQSTIYCVTTGATGSFKNAVHSSFDRDLSNGLTQPQAQAGWITNVNTTVDIAIDFRVLWGTANALNLITSYFIFGEALN